MREDFGMLVVAEARDKGKDTVDGNVVAQHERDGQIFSFFDSAEGQSQCECHAQKVAIKYLQIECKLPVM